MTARGSGSEVHASVSETLEVQASGGSPRVLRSDLSGGSQLNFA